jgi:hypothetical protein
MDAFEKGQYKTAITAWIIVLIILACFLALMICLVRKGMEVLKAEGDNLKSLQVKLDKKKQEASHLKPTAGGPKTPGGGKISTGEDEVMGGFLHNGLGPEEDDL